MGNKTDESRMEALSLKAKRTLCFWYEGQDKEWAYHAQAASLGVKRELHKSRLVEMRWHASEPTLDRMHVRPMGRRVARKLYEGLSEKTHIGC